MRVSCGVVRDFVRVIVVKSVGVVTVTVNSPDGVGFSAGDVLVSEGFTLGAGVNVPKSIVDWPRVGSKLNPDVKVVADAADVVEVAEENVEVERTTDVWLTEPPLSPRILAATPLFAQPTRTPRVLFIGSAKHAVSSEQTDMTKFPPSLQFPTFPAIQAISPDVQGDEKFRLENNVLYPLASARLELYCAGLSEVGVAKLVGKVVGILVIVTGALVIVEL